MNRRVFLSAAVALLPVLATVAVPPSLRAGHAQAGEHHPAAAVLLAVPPLPQSAWRAPADGEMRLFVGHSGEVTARRAQVDFIRVSADITEAAWQLRLANAGPVPVSVVVRESFGSDWLVMSESARHVREDAFTAAWTVTVPAHGETELSYRARVKN